SGDACRELTIEIAAGGATFSTKSFEPEPDGSHRLKLPVFALDTSELPLRAGCTRMLRVAADGLGQKSVALRRAQEFVEIQFESPADLALALVNYDERARRAGLRAARVHRSDDEKTHGWESSPHDVPDESGTILMRDLQPGATDLAIVWCATPSVSAEVLL